MKPKVSIESNISLNCDSKTKKTKNLNWNPKLKTKPKQPPNKPKQIETNPKEFATWPSGTLGLEVYIGTIFKSWFQILKNAQKETYLLVYMVHVCI